MGRWLDGFTALFAFIAAVFWFLSAADSLPPIVTYWGRAPETDPFYQAMKFSALMNMIAAGCSGMSALLFGLRVAFWPFANRHSLLERTEAREGATMTFSEGRQEWRDDLQKIRTSPKLHGIEKSVGRGLFVLNTATPTRLIQLFFYGRRDRAPKTLPDWYVGLATVLLVILFLATPPGGMLIMIVIGFAFYLLFSIIVYLLNVVLLDHKVFGDVRSPERSLILFMLNVVQVVLIFAIFYGWWGVSRPLAEALLVLGTASFPQEAKGMAAFQVATDVVLLAVFLAHFVGRVGRDDEKSPPQTTP